MNNVFFEDGTMRQMERFLDLAAQRQSLISSNLANVDTPGYKALDLDFKTELETVKEEQDARAVLTNNRHIAIGVDRKGNQAVSPEEVEGLTLRNDLNNINVDREMTQLSTNALKFSMVAQLLAGTIRTIKNAINEGR